MLLFKTKVVGVCVCVHHRDMNNGKSISAEIPGPESSVDQAISINPRETLCDLPYL